MENFWKSLLTGLIWLLCTGMGLAAIITNQLQATVVPVMAIALAASLLATFVIWAVPALAGTGQRSVSVEARQGEKPKRQSSSQDRMALLMEMMDDDERAAFKETLKRRILSDHRLTEDGEFVSDSASLGSLLYDDSEQGHYNR